MRETWIKLRLKDIGINFIPENQIQITYQNQISIQKIGQVVKAEQVQEPPHLYFRADPEKLYTVIMFDPDAPSRATAPIGKNWLHWVVVNIPGSNIEVGETTVTYVGAGPPKDTGLHRYVFLAFEQNKSVKWPRFDWLQKTHENREKWDLNEFINTFGKDLADDLPVAAGCFRSEWDECVPSLYAELQYNYDVQPRKLMAIL